jgi:hypothetical protein
MHRPAAMLTGQSSAPKSRAPCLVNIAPPISGGTQLVSPPPARLGSAAARHVSACVQIRTIFNRAILHLRIGYCRTTFGNHMSIRPPPSGRAGDLTYSRITTPRHPRHGILRLGAFLSVPAGTAVTSRRSTLKSPSFA